jgi:Mrp family chromosome partitioning ATPase
MGRAVKERVAWERAASSAHGGALRDACRVALLQVPEDRRSRLGVISAIRGEGRTTIALALAYTLVRDFNQRTVLVDLDFTEPALSNLYADVSAMGMADVLAGGAPLEEVLQRIEPGLSVIAAGQPGSRTPQYLAMRLERSGLVERLAANGQAVVADLPPLLESVVGPTLAPAFIQTIMVVRAGVTPVGLVRQALATLASPPEVLLNGAPEHLPKWLARLVGD